MIKWKSKIAENLRMKRISVVTKRRKRNGRRGSWSHYDWGTINCNKV